MKKSSYILFLLLCILLVSCENQHSENSLNAGAFDESVENSDVDNETSLINESSVSVNESSETESRNERIIVNENISSVEFEKENGDFSFIVYEGGFVSSDLTYYSKYENAVYTCVELKQDNAKSIFGTAKFVDGKMTNFFPNIFEVVQYQGVLYGVRYTEAELSDAKRIYCRLNNDGSYVDMFESGNPTFLNDKIYYFEYDKALSVHRLVSADLDGKNKIVISENNFSAHGTRIFGSNEAILFNSDYSECVLMSENKESIFIEKEDSCMQSVEIVNNGYVYYSKTKYTTHGFSDTVEIWRKKIDGSFCEKLLSVEEDHSSVNYVIFSNKLIVFLPDGIYAFESDFSSPTVYDYGKHEYSKIVQICATTDEIAVITFEDCEKYNILYKTTVYDTSGEIVFEYAG